MLYDPVTDSGVGAEIRGRVFLVGCPRSGTTLLQSMLASHPAVQSFPETHFFDRAFGRRHLPRRAILGGLYIRSYAREWLKDAVGVNGTSAALPFTWRRAPVVHAFWTAIDRITAASGRSVWLEKTPRHLFYVPVIQRYIPSARFVHMVRDGRAVVASLHAAARANPGRWRPMLSVERCIARWNRSVATSAAFLGQPGHHPVSYESLTEQPEQVLRQICGALNLSYDPRMVEDFGRTAASLVRDHESWKQGNFQELRSTGLDAYERLFDPDTRRWIDAALDWASYRRILALTELRHSQTYPRQ